MPRFRGDLPRSRGTTAVRLFPLVPPRDEDTRLAGRSRLQPTDSVRSIVDCAPSLAWRSIDKTAGATSGGRKSRERAGGGAEGATAGERRGAER